MANYLLSNNGNLIFTHNSWVWLRKYFTPEEIFKIQDGENRNHKNLIKCYNEHYKDFPNCRVVVSEADSVKITLRDGVERLS